MLTKRTLIDTLNARFFAHYEWLRARSSGQESLPARTRFPELMALEVGTGSYDQEFKADLIVRVRLMTGEERTFCGRVSQSSSRSEICFTNVDDLGHEERPVIEQMVGHLLFHLLAFEDRNIDGWEDLPQGAVA